MHPKRTRTRTATATQTERGIRLLCLRFSPFTPPFFSWLSALSPLLPPNGRNSIGLYVIPPTFLSFSGFASFSSNIFTAFLLLRSSTSQWHSTQKLTAPFISADLSELDKMSTSGAITIIPCVQFLVPSAQKTISLSHFLYGIITLVQKMLTSHSFEWLFDPNRNSFLIQLLSAPEQTCLDLALSAWRNNSCSQKKGEKEATMSWFCWSPSILCGSKDRNKTLVFPLIPNWDCVGKAKVTMELRHEHVISQKMNDCIHFTYSQLTPALFKLIYPHFIYPLVTHHHFSLIYQSKNEWLHPLYVELTLAAQQLKLSRFYCNINHMQKALCA